MLSGEGVNSGEAMRELQAVSIRKTESSRQYDFKNKNFGFSIMVHGDEKFRVFS